MLVKMKIQTAKLAIKVGSYDFTCANNSYEQAWKNLLSSLNQKDLIIVAPLDLKDTNLMQLKRFRLNKLVILLDTCVLDDPYELA